VGATGRAEVGKFQSHAGSIEANRHCGRSPEEPFRFNPTLVRLRRLRGAPGPGRDAAFQSHAGSIEAVASSASTEKEMAFQSHAGSIEAIEIIPL